MSKTDSGFSILKDKIWWDKIKNKRKEQYFISSTIIYFPILRLYHLLEDHSFYPLYVSYITKNFGLNFFMLKHMDPFTIILSEFKSRKPFMKK